jgi:peptidoglycan/xylan/chitin deacetylase (PgdA/CDA1 family)
MVKERALKDSAPQAARANDPDPGRILPARLRNLSAVERASRFVTGGMATVTTSEMTFVQHTLGNRQVGELLGGLNTTASAVGRAELGKAQAAAEPPAPTLRVGGAVNSKKIVRIAWTFDDGPTEIVTGQVEKITRGIPSTWYVMRNQVEAGDRNKNLSELKNKQDQGQEIAIHSMHQTMSHAAWFPSTLPSYNDIESAMKDLRSFHALLSAAGIRVRFVRLPGGLISELVNYLHRIGIGNKDLRERVARDIIAGHPVPPVTEDVRKLYKVKADFEFMKSELAALGLHEWGGAGPDKSEIGPQSWEAESEPPSTGLTDDLIQRFKKVVDKTAQDGRSRSLVVLAHDTPIEKEKPAAGKSATRVAKIGQDIEDMEKYASGAGVRVEYFRMSDLYRVIRKAEP